MRLQRQNAGDCRRLAALSRWSPLALALRTGGTRALRTGAGQGSVLVLREIVSEFLFGDTLARHEQ